MKLRGHKAIITGSSQGLGKVIAEVMAAEGCEVVVNCAHHAEKAIATAESIKAAGNQASAYCCDITDAAAVKKMFDDLGNVDILVNNARLNPWLRDKSCPDDEWFMRVMQVNLLGAYNCSMEFFNRAKERNYGRIVNVSSVRSFMPSEMPNIAYSVSKSGMHAMTRAFAHNGAPYNILCNTVAPGVIITENFTKRIPPEKVQSELAAVPLGRGASCQEVADAVIFAICNGYVTGETININGGMYYEP